MKLTTAYYLMLIYATVMVKPLLPFIQDAWAHEFNEIEHLSCVHAKYGSNHLQKEATAEFENNNNKNQTSLRIEDPISFHLIAVHYQHANIIVSKSLKPNSIYAGNPLPTVYLSIQGQPPKFS